ncbi:hypothetical protein BLOT_010167 [Blomia tropicalis]|nr:hypothetical protein BLOT_010167 [Blomia tropicalis]
MSMTRGCLVIRLSTKTQLALCLQRQCDHRPVYKTNHDRHNSSGSSLLFLFAVGRTSTWPPIIGTTLLIINLAADHWDDTLEHRLGQHQCLVHLGDRVNEKIKLLLELDEKSIIINNNKIGKRMAANNISNIFNSNQSKWMMNFQFSSRRMEISTPIKHTCTRCAKPCHWSMFHQDLLLLKLANPVFQDGSLRRAEFFAYMFRRLLRKSIVFDNRTAADNRFKFGRDRVDGKASVSLSYARRGTFSATN